MPRHIARRLSSLGIQVATAALSCLLFLHTAAVSGQQTPLSAQINAEARYVAATGYMARSVAEARSINADAVAKEIQNSVDYVKAYYERRHIYEEEWRRKHPDAITLENERQKRLRERVEKQYQALMRGSDRNVTDMLNWLSRELSNSVVSYQYVFAGRSAVLPTTDMKLTEQDLKRIRLTDGGREASRLVFAAGDGAVLVPKWPLGLRRPECKAARDNYDTVREAVVKEVQTTGKIGYENQTELMRAVNDLFTALDAAFPPERLKDEKEFLVFATGKRYVQSLVASVHRAITINDASVFSGENRFHGSTVFELVQHMHRNGLEFAPPEPGAEGIYRTLFENLRTMYIDIGREQTPADAHAPKAAGDDQPPKDKDEPKKDRNV
jgi:hypothetical protein